MTRERLLCGAAIGFSVVTAVVCWSLLALTPVRPWTQFSSTLLLSCAPLFTVLGTVIVRRGHGHRIGRLLIGIGIALGVDALAASAAMAYVGGLDVPFGPWLAWSDDFIWAPLLFGAWLLVLMFPDGRLPHRLARVAVAVGCVVAGGIVALVPFHSGQLIDYPEVTSPVAPVPVLTAVARAVVPVLQPGVPLMFLLVGVCVVVRYRSSGAEARAQIRWLAWWAVLVGILILLQVFTPPSWLPVIYLASALTFPALPAVVAIAVLRYRLYDIDRLLSRTLSYALLTGVVVALYAGVVAGVSALLHGGTGASGALGVAAATLAAVSVVRPLRRRLQAAVDRRFDRARHDAHSTVAAYAERLRAADPDRDHEADLLEVLDRTVGPRHAFLWVPGTGAARATTTGA